MRAFKEVTLLGKNEMLSCKGFLGNFTLKLTTLCPWKIFFYSTLYTMLLSLYFTFECVMLQINSARKM